MKAPPGPRDRDHHAAQVVMVPLSDDATAFTARFGVDIYTVFNMTEISLPDRVRAQPGTYRKHAAGRATASRRASSTNTTCEVAAGAVGELIVRTDDALGDEPRLPRQSRGDRARLAQRLVPHRRRVPPRRRTAISSSSTA